MLSKTGNGDKRLRRWTKNGAPWPGWSLKRYVRRFPLNLVVSARTVH